MRGEEDVPKISRALVLVAVRTVHTVHMGRTRGGAGQRRRGRRTAAGVPGHIQGAHIVAAFAVVGIAARTAVAAVAAARIAARIAVAAVAAEGIAARTEVAGTVLHTGHTQEGPHMRGVRIGGVAHTAAAAEPRLLRPRLSRQDGLDRCKRQSHLPRETWSCVHRSPVESRRAPRRGGRCRLPSSSRVQRCRRIRHLG